MTHPASVDVHTHLAPLLDEAVLGDLGVAYAAGVYEVDGEGVGPAALYDVAGLTGWLAGVGVDRAWVSLPPPFFRQGLDAVLAAAWASAANDGVLARIADRPELEGLAYLPLDHPWVALAEIERLSETEDFVGWSGSAGGGSLPLDDEALDAVWSAVEASGRPMLLHPGSTRDPRFTRHYLANLLGNAEETTLAVAQLVFGNVLGTHSDLRLVLVHCGGAVAAMTGRWQQGVDTRRPGVGELSLAPRQAVRRFWVDALAHDAAVVDLAVQVFGQDKVVLGSDWPFPMGLDDPWSAVAHLPVTRRDEVGRANAMALRGCRQ